MTSKMMDVDDLVAQMLGMEADLTSLIYTDLIEDASILLKVDPWAHISPKQTIVIEDEDGRVGFVTLPYMKDQLRMVRIYDGPEGLVSLLNHRENIAKQSHELTLFKSYTELNGFSLDFVNRDVLTDEDYELIKACGFSFRGKLRWPMIRRLAPGNEDTLLCHDEDIYFMNICTSMIIELTEQLATGNISFPQSEDELIKLRYDFEEDKMVCETTSLAHYLQTPKPLIMQDELRLHRLKKLQKEGYALEISGHYLMESYFQEVTEWGETVASFPFMCTAVNVDTGMVLQPLVDINKDEVQANFFNWLSQNLLDLGCTPYAIITDHTMQHWLQPLCESLDIPLHIQDSLPNTLEFFDSMHNDLD